MVACNQTGDGGRTVQADQVKAAPGTLVHDVETESLPYPKSRAGHRALDSKSCNPCSTPASFKEGYHHRVGKDSPTQHILLGRLQSEDESGESSPTCVIKNSAMRSNSSSSTMSTISKASSEPGRGREGRYRGTRRGGISTPDYDDEASPRAFPASEPRKIGDTRRLEKSGCTIPTRPILKGAPLLRRVETDSSAAKENGWSMAHDDLRGEAKESQTAPFKSIQSALADKTVEPGARKVKRGGIPLTKTPQSASVMNGSAGIFSFNATYMPRTGYDSNSLHELDGKATESDSLTRVHAHKTLRIPLLKPTPSKWDDAEKWLSCGDTPAKTTTTTTRSTSGPLLAQMVASQAGILMPRRGPLSSQFDRYYSGPLTGFAFQQTTGLTENVDVAEKKSSARSPGAGGVLLDFSPDEKEKLNLLLNRYSSMEGGVEAANNGSVSPECNGSFLKLARRGARPKVESPPIDSELRNEFSRIAATRDMGTAMTPIVSVEASRTGTPIRSTTPEKNPVNNIQAGPTIIATCNDDAHGAATENKAAAAESPRAWSEKELQEKTRQEILALGTQLGKANITAWAKGEEKDVETVLEGNKGAQELENLQRSVLATRAAAWEEAEKAKYMSRFQQDEAKIRAWEEHEKAKAEAEMRRVERQAVELRTAAEARRAKAANRAARKAEAMKTHGKFINLLFLSYLCT
ncbi:uncharacterized protein [Physcomitrium patens]|uniref:uncharacterized protein isoform X2 n=1 Tax=Physcomitrium patens TaxID=3218 RepID=UPI00024AB5AB|nr:uncharacterized protein LOC112278002 isoform X2 [Physcomitrium patens]|eukprot:XP_024366717.1 uncharacterized protein LOC112278002 isoform X2 [Physcomitrella patens]